MSNDKVVVKAASKIRLRVYGEKAVIYRNDGYPSIEDRTTESVLWLERNGYKPEEIEIIGEKPSNWDAVFNPTPVAVEAVEALPEVTAAEALEA